MRAAYQEPNLLQNLNASSVVKGAARRLKLLFKLSGNDIDHPAATATVVFKDRALVMERYQRYGVMRENAVWHCEIL